MGCSMKFFHKPNRQQKSPHLTIVPTPRSIIMLTLHRLSNEILPHGVKKCQHLVFLDLFFNLRNLKKKKPNGDIFGTSNSAM